MMRWQQGYKVQSSSNLQHIMILMGLLHRNHFFTVLQIKTLQYWGPSNSSPWLSSWIPPWFSSSPVGKQQQKMQRTISWPECMIWCCSWHAAAVTSKHSSTCIPQVGLSRPPLLLCWMPLPKLFLQHSCFDLWIWICFFLCVFVCGDWWLCCVWVCWFLYIYVGCGWVIMNQTTGLLGWKKNTIRGAKQGAVSPIVWNGIMNQGIFPKGYSVSLCLAS